MTRDSNVSKPLKEDYIIRIKSRIEQHIDEPMEDEEKEEFLHLDITETTACIVVF